MLTVKIMSPGGGEEIHCGLSVGFNPAQKSIAISGMDQNIFLKEGEIAYVMNANGRTISRYMYAWDSPTQPDPLAKGHVITDWLGVTPPQQMWIRSPWGNTPVVVTM